MMAKIKNDRSRYVKRSEVSPGSPRKLSNAHLKPNAKRAERVVERLAPLRRAFIEL
jgi:hypothetical protein